MHFNTLKYFFLSIERIREKLSELIRKEDSYGILAKLILNEGSSQQPFYFLRRLGFVHLLSPSGIHIDIIGQIIYGLNHILLTRILKIFSWQIKWRLFPFVRVSSGIIACLFCLLIGFLNGARFGLFRPCFLLILRIIGHKAGTHWKKLAPLILTLLLDWQLEQFFSNSEEHVWIQTGRWIYTLAIGGGLLWSKTLPQQHLSLAIGSWILVALWEVLECGTISLGTAFMSWLTLPILCGWIYPCILLILTFQSIGTLIKPIVIQYYSHQKEFLMFENWLFLENFAQSLLCWTVKGFSRLILKFIEYSLLPGNLWILSPIALLIGFSMGTLFIMVRRHTRYSPLLGGFLLFICLIMRYFLTNPFFSIFLAKAESHVEANWVEQLDIGQGDAALVYTLYPSKNIGMIDTGLEKALTDDQWIQLFAKRNIYKLNWIHLSHLDHDHAGGIFRLAKLIHIGCLFASKSELNTYRGSLFLKKIRRLNIKITISAEKCIPYPTFQVESKKNSRFYANQNMNAIWIPIYPQGFYLSAGDASSSDEASIAIWAKKLSKDRQYPRILKINHHGSSTSTSLNYLKTISPTEAWISSGVGNPYGHPKPAVLERIKGCKIPIRRTDRDGHLFSNATFL